jgi:methylmalonyl-CoA mutase cobalamin-binding subunit
MGIAEVFTPGTPLDAIVTYIRENAPVRVAEQL